MAEMAIFFRLFHLRPGAGTFTEFGDSQPNNLISIVQNLVYFKPNMFYNAPSTENDFLTMFEFR